MRRLACAAAFALAASSAATAHAVEYGDQGTMELGGTLAFENKSTDFDQQGKQAETLAVISPQFGMFLAPGVQVIGQLEVGSDSVKPKGGSTTSATLMGLGVGGAYLVRTGTVMVGPELLLDYSNLQVKFPGFLGAGTTTIKESGPGATLGLLAKMPVGGGGVITAGLDYQYQDLSADVSGGGVSGSDSGNASNFGTFVGFSVFFGGGK